MKLKLLIELLFPHAEDFLILYLVICVQKEQEGG